MPSFSETLERLMKACGDTNAALAAATGLSQTRISELRNGQRDPEWPIVEALLKRYVNTPCGLNSPEAILNWVGSAGFNLTPQHLQNLLPDANLPTLKSLPPQLPANCVERDELEADVKLLLEGESPVVLTGMGGSGKSTLARVIMHQCYARFSEGVLWVEMPLLSDRDTFEEHLVTRLNLFRMPSQPRHEVLLGHLGRSS